MLKEEMTAQTNQMNRNRTSQSSKNVLNSADEIKNMKERIEEEKVVQTDMDDNIKTLQSEIIE